MSDTGPNIAGAHLACGHQFPTCGDGKFLPFGNNRLTDIHLTHRVFVYLGDDRDHRPAQRRLRPRLARPAARPGRAASLLCQFLLGAPERLARRARAADRRPPRHRDPALGHCRLDRLPARLASQRAPTRERAPPGPKHRRRPHERPPRHRFRAASPAAAARRASQVSVTPGDARRADDAHRDRCGERLRHAHQAADHLPAPAHLRGDDVRRRPGRPGALHHPLDLPRRLSGRRRRRGDQPLHRARAATPAWPAPRAGPWPAGGSSRGADCSSDRLSASSPSRSSGSRSTA